MMNKPMTHSVLSCSHLISQTSIAESRSLETMKNQMLTAESHEYHDRLKEYLQAVEQESSQRARIDPLRFSRGERPELDALFKV